MRVGIDPLPLQALSCSETMRTIIEELRKPVVFQISAGERTPFPDSSFEAALNIVTLEHVPEPGGALAEIARTLAPGGRLLLIVPHEWEVHQAPHDYFRYTRHGVEYLLDRAGFDKWNIEPVGGYFRMLARRLLNGLQFFPGLLVILAALFLVPPALILPLLDSLDSDRNFTLGYICVATKRS